MMKNFSIEEIKKVGLLNYIMPRFKDYRLDEERHFYDIVPNRFKNNNRRSFLRIDKDSHEVIFLGPNLADKLYMLSLLDYIPLDNEYMLNLFKIIYDAAEKYKIYNSSKNKSHHKNILNRLNNKNRLAFTSIFKTHFDVVGLISSKKKHRDLIIVREYMLTDEYQLVEIYSFSVPIPYAEHDSTEFNVKVTYLKGEWNLYCEIKKETVDGIVGVDYSFNDLDVFKLLIDNEFAKHYKAVVKDSLDIDTDTVDDDHVTLLRMMTI